MDEKIAKLVKELRRAPDHDIDTEDLTDRAAAALEALSAQIAEAEARGAARERERCGKFKKHEDTADEQ